MKAPKPYIYPEVQTILSMEGRPYKDVAEKVGRSVGAVGVVYHEYRTFKSGKPESVHSQAMREFFTRYAKELNNNAVQEMKEEIHTKNNNQEIETLLTQMEQAFTTLQETVIALAKVKALQAEEKARQEVNQEISDLRKRVRDLEEFKNMARESTPTSQLRRFFGNKD